MSDLKSNGQAPRMTILLPHQIQLVRMLVKEAFEDGEFEQGVGYIHHYEPNYNIPRSAFWDAVCLLEQNGELEIDDNCTEVEGNCFSVWVMQTETPLNHNWDDISDHNASLITEAVYGAPSCKCGSSHCAYCV